MEHSMEAARYDESTANLWPSINCSRFIAVGEPPCWTGSETKDVNFSKKITLLYYAVI